MDRHPTELTFAYDLTLDEELAWDMLYADLDDDQQRIYDELVRAGVLPDRAVNRVSD